ncbi:hypothetical protein TNCV_3555841 [Trichonephila clavipes]|nr:hypothetical protein TNCV_3555841 [Trichonephila clavipes]
MAEFHCQKGTDLLSSINKYTEQRDVLRHRLTELRVSAPLGDFVLLSTRPQWDLQGLENSQDVATNSNSVAQQSMRAKQSCAHLSIRERWALRLHEQMSRSGGQSEAKLQESLVLILSTR